MIDFGRKIYILVRGCFFARLEEKIGIVFFTGNAMSFYYKDVPLRMKNKELDSLIVVNMFLTGFDATTMNTLWVDKNLKMHGLIQAFSSNLQKRVDTLFLCLGIRVPKELLESKTRKILLLCLARFSV